MVARARGRVLDLGFGLDHLGAYAGVGAVDEVVALEDDPEAAQHFERRAQSDGVPLVTVPTRDLGPVGDLHRFDTVVSVVALPLFADLDGVLAAVFDHLHPGGRLLALEPSADHRATTRLLDRGGQLLPPVSRLSLGREVPSAIRRCGFRITDLERLTMPTMLWPLRPVVRLTARRPDGEVVDGEARDGEPRADEGGRP
jgi:SAM-dependent methyltransferase